MSEKKETEEKGVTDTMKSEIEVRALVATKVYLKPKLVIDFDDAWIKRGFKSRSDAVRTALGDFISPDYVMDTLKSELEGMEGDATPPTADERLRHIIREEIETARNTWG